VEVPLHRAIVWIELYIAITAVAASQPAQKLDVCAALDGGCIYLLAGGLGIFYIGGEAVIAEYGGGDIAVSHIRPSSDFLLQVHEDGGVHCHNG